MTTPVNTRVSLHFVVGQDEEGEMIYQARHFNNVKETAEDEALTTVFEALASLQVNDLHAMERSNTYDLIS